MKTRHTFAIVAALLAFAFLGLSSAQAGHHHRHGSVGGYVGLPGMELAFGTPCPAPVYYYHPAPVVVYREPVVIHRPAPVVVHRAPVVVYTAPRPACVRVYPRCR